MTMKRIFVLGSINIDLVMETRTMPMRGETLFGDNFFVNPGGKGANQAVTCAKQGIETILIGSVGDDAFGIQAISSLETYGVHCENVKKKSNCTTGVAIILVENHDNRILLSSGANIQMSEQDIEDGLLGANPEDVFIAQFENNPEATLYGLKRAREKGLTVILNPAPARSIDITLLKHVDYLILNETECEAITGIVPDELPNIQKAQQKMIKLGCSKTVLTVGSRGCYSLMEENIQHYPACMINPVDTTAAGDTFVGGFAFGLIVFSGNLEKSILYATKAAALTCLKKGAQQSIPTRNEVEAYTTS